MREISSFFAFLITHWMVYRILYDAWDELIEDVKFWFTPDLLSALKGRFYDDFWGEMRLFIWVGSASAVSAGVYALW